MWKDCFTRLIYPSSSRWNDLKISEMHPVLFLNNSRNRRIIVHLRSVSWCLIILSSRKPLLFSHSGSPSSAPLLFSCSVGRHPPAPAPGQISQDSLNSSLHSSIHWQKKIWLCPEVCALLRSHPLPRLPISRRWWRAKKMFLVWVIFATSFYYFF